MAILNIVLSQTGLVGVAPSIAYIATNNTLAEVTTTGFLNQAVQQGNAFADNMICLVSTKTSPSATVTSVGWLEISHVGANWSLIPSGAPGSVTLPTIANHIAVFTNTTGNLSEDVATAINGGKIQSGLVAGSVVGEFIAYPTTASKGFLSLKAAVNATGNFSTTISNVTAQAQSSVLTIPDVGAATGNFILSGTAGASQNITSGSFVVEAGAINSGLSSGGFIGLIKAFPTTASKGFMALQAAINATGNFGTTILNATAQAQASAITIPDCGAATANFLLSALTGAGFQDITSGSLEVDAGALISGIATGGFVGLVKAFPTTASKGFIALQAAVNATGDFGTTITNGLAIAQAQVLTIPDVGAATGFINGQSVTANLTPASVIIIIDISMGFAALATAGKINIQSALATAQFKVRDIKVNYSASGLSGGGGDRLIVVTDGTTIYNNAGITAALLGTPINTLWGGTGNPIAGTVAQNTSTVAGAQLYAQYSGGANDYTAGSVVITVTYERVA